MDHTKELIKRAHEGDKQARDKLVIDNMGLVYCISKRFAMRGYDMEDINQIGTIGLIKAIDKFDDSFDVKFSTYAVPMIAGEIKRFLRDDGMIKVSRTLKENGYKVKRASEQYTSENGHEPTVENLAAATELSVEDVVLALEANSEVESIYKTVYQSEGNEVYLLDKMSEKNSTTIQNKYESPGEKIVDKVVLEQLMDTLNEKEKQIITLRYFHDKTQTQIANQLGISQVQVSRMEKKILVKLRELLI